MPKIVPQGEEGRSLLGVQRLLNGRGGKGLAFRPSFRILGPKGGFWKQVWRKDLGPHGDPGGALLGVKKVLNGGEGKGLAYKAPAGILGTRGGAFGSPGWPRNRVPRGMKGGNLWGGTGP